MKRNTKIRSLILNRITESPKQTVFFLTDFSEFGSIETTRKILTQAVSEGLLRHVAHGIYVKPRMTEYGELTASLEDIAVKIAERDHAKLMPTGSYAANILGMSTQVPMVVAYLTTGSSRKVKIRNGYIDFRHAAPRNFAYKGTTIPLIVQAFKDFGPDQITDGDISALYYYMRRAKDSDTFRGDILIAPQWIQTIVKPIINNILSNETLATK